MRVSILLEQLLSPVPGGGGRYAAELAAGLARTAGTGDSVQGWVGAHRHVSDACVPGVLGPRRLPLPRRGLIAAWERGLPPTVPGDVIHAPTLLIPPRGTTPLVVSIHDAVPWTHPETLTPRGVHWHKAMAGVAATRAAVVTTLTEVIRHQLCDLIPALDPGRVRVIGAGVSAALRADPGPDRTAEVRRRLGLPETFVLSLATLEPRKGLDVLLDALALLGDSAPVLVTAGQAGWGGVDPLAEAARRGLREGGVHARGRVSDDDLAVLLRSADALVMPSRAEGFGLPVAEAMAVGTPVICSDAAALVEVSAGAALVVPVGDAAALAQAIEAVTTDQDLRERLGAAGLARAVAFDWDTVAHKAWAIYRELNQSAG